PDRRRPWTAGQYGLLRRLAEQEERSGYVADALFPILAQAALNQRADCRRHVRGKRVPVGLAAQYGRERVAHVLAVESTFPRQHLEQHGTEGPDVRAFVYGLPTRLLRAHVRR